MEATDKARVLVLGSMEKTNDAFAPSTKTQQLGKAIQALAKALNLTQYLDIDTPDNIPAGSITEEVFARIDIADLCIIGLSGYHETSVPSPNVIMEIALADALGVPRVLISDGSSETPFYLKDESIISINAYSMEALQTPVTPILNATAGQQTLQANLGQTPFTRFYGAPLVNVSAAVGIAVTYWRNYIHTLCAQGGSIERENENSSGLITDLVVAIPQKIDNIDTDIPILNNTLQQLAEQADVAFSLNRTLAAKTNKARTAVVIGPIAIDIPRTVASLKSSPRYRKANNLRPQLQQQLTTNNNEILERIELSLLRHFQESINALISSFDEPLFTKIHLLPISEVAGFVRERLIQ